VVLKKDVFWLKWRPFYAPMGEDKILKSYKGSEKRVSFLLN